MAAPSGPQQTTPSTGGAGGYPMSWSVPLLSKEGLGVVAPSGPQQTTPSPSLERRGVKRYRRGPHGRSGFALNIHLTLD